MANKTLPKADWRNVDVNSLPKDIREAYEAYKAAYKQMKVDREWFETATRKHLSDALPDGKTVAFSYNFGKLSVAVVDDDDRKAVRPSGSIDLAALVRRA